MGGGMGMYRIGFLLLLATPSLLAQEPLMAARWSPYWAGAGLGVVIALSFLIANKPIGFSSSYAQLAANISKLLHGGKSRERYFQNEVQPGFGWELMLFLGAIIGAALAAWLSHSWELTMVDDRWVAMTGWTTWWSRGIVAFLGGILLAFGARWAGGCTSGHGLSGTAQLVVSSWLAAFCFFAGGVGFALLFDALI